MTILFRSTPVREPLTFESIGQDGRQESVSRPGGYPFYHYLQTEKGDRQGRDRFRILCPQGERGAPHRPLYPALLRRHRRQMVYQVRLIYRHCGKLHPPDRWIPPDHPG